jgi:excisionase family DNA binding protein
MVIDMYTWMTRAEAAEYLRVTPKTIDRYVERGQLVRFTIAGSRSTRFRKDMLDRLLAPEGSEGSWTYLGSEATLSGQPAVDHTGEIRDPSWTGDRAPCGCPRQSDLWLCSVAGPWTPACPSWPSWLPNDGRKTD